MFFDNVDLLKLDEQLEVIAGECGGLIVPRSSPRYGRPWKQTGMGTINGWLPKENLEYEIRCPYHLTKKLIALREGMCSVMEILEGKKS